ncbi:MAG: HAMP domain-containing histidine kinase, partial [Rhodocyclaceae bacterium]|nr:HAMP domain-containing histidine kinase [Rhodocyclaceae bacterium]
QTGFVAQVQGELAHEQESAARENLVSVHEAGHVNLARLFANVLWESDFAPFVARARGVSVDRCRLAAAADPAAAKACFAEAGARIVGLPGFEALDRRAYAMMQKTTVFKIKVFDLRGITVYSSEHRQIGEDKAGNEGWRTAVRGRPASELTHRDKFSAFEGVVENRDLISSYLPVFSPSGEEVVGVFEIYSDVTPFLERNRATAARIESLVAANQSRVEKAARENGEKVREGSDRLLLVVGGLLVLLYGVTVMLVRRGQRIIDAQALAQEQSARREDLWHREKMAALATMAANVSHEVGNPLAVISGMAEVMAEEQAKGVCAVCQPRLILSEAQRIAVMTRRIADFATARSERPELVDAGQMAAAVCEFMSFDRQFQRLRFEHRPTGPLPVLTLVPDHFNEVLMNLLQVCAENAAAAGVGGLRVVVATAPAGSGVSVRVAVEGEGVAGSGEGWSGDPRVQAARRRAAGMGGPLVATAAGFEVTLAEPAVAEAV